MTSTTHITLAIILYTYIWYINIYHITAPFPLLIYSFLNCCTWRWRWATCDNCVKMENGKQYTSKRPSLYIYIYSLAQTISWWNFSASKIRVITISNQRTQAFLVAYICWYNEIVDL